MEPAEEIALELEGDLRELQDAHAAADRIYEAIYKTMCETAFREFPALKNMSAAQFRLFDDQMTRRACDCAIEIADLASAAGQEK